MNCCHGHPIKMCGDCSPECHMEIEDLRKSVKDLTSIIEQTNLSKADLRDRAEKAESRAAKLEAALRRYRATLEEIASLAELTDAPGWTLRTIEFEARTTLEKNNA